MSSRPAIPLDAQREVLFEARHHCAVCCFPTALERAHIIPWRDTQDHSAANLIALCANCHTRFDKEKWPESDMRRYKQRPCIVERDRLPPMPADKKAMVDIILNMDPESMTERQRLFFASSVAAYAGVLYSDVRIVSITSARSSRVRLELPRHGAEALIAGFQADDPQLFAFLDDAGGATGVLRIEAAGPETQAGKTDTSEKGLETLIFSGMTAVGWIAGDPKDYDRDYAVDLLQLSAFLRATQEGIAAELQIGSDTPERRKFVARLQAELSSRGVIDVLRHGVKHGKHEVTLRYGTPSPGNEKAAALFDLNRFSVTRQLRYSRDETRRALDLCLFINGLPVATFELKNSLTKQTVDDAIEQYRRDRDPRELLFKFGRCMVHFAMDDQQVQMCTELKGKASWFLPFNQGWKDGAGNPPNPYGIQTDYFWRRIFTPRGLTDIIENYAQIVEEKNEKTGKKRRKQVFPRFHQLEIVRRLLADVAWHGAGKRYLIQHSEEGWCPSAPAARRLRTFHSAARTQRAAPSPGRRYGTDLARWCCRR